MARSAPLIPLPLLILLLLVLSAALIVSALPRVRARWPWLLPETSSSCAVTARQNLLATLARAGSVTVAPVMMPR